MAVYVILMAHAPAASKIPFGYGASGMARPVHSHSAMTQTRLTFVLQALALLLITGCGDDSGSSAMDASSGADARAPDDGRAPSDSPTGTDTGGGSTAGLALGGAGGFVILAKSG